MSQLNLYTILKRGELHPNFCEDAVLLKPINETYLLAMVADGCSSGQESHFAATLLKKIWSKIVKLLPYRHFQDASFDINNMEVDSLLKYLCYWFWEEIRTFKNDYYLEFNELVATMLVGIYNIEKQTLALMLSGDGVYAVNDKIYVVDQDDKPNYLAYHLDKKLDMWWKSKALHCHYDRVQNFALSTDGVLSFAKDYKLDDSGIDIPNYLLVNQQYSQQENMLARKVIDLYNKYQLLTNEDLGIVRVLL